MKRELAGASQVRAVTGRWAGTGTSLALAGGGDAAHGAFPHVVAWNLTRRCNLACSHCYIAAGSWHGSAGEMETRACLGIVDQILSVNPSPLLILSGGEPLAREDLEEIAAHAARGGATVVVGTNGTGLTPARIESLKEAGVQGFAVSVDSLNPRYHDRFRHGGGALAETLAAVDRLRAEEMDVVIQTTLTRGNREEIPDLVAWAARQGAVCFNLYFLVQTGRGERMEGLSASENDGVVRQLARLQAEYRGRLMVRSKCQPQLMRHVYETDAESPLLNYRTRCPCGVQYCRITPEGQVTPCPYLPAVAGDLREASFEEVWWESSLFRLLRRGTLGGRCGRCEYRELCGGCRARAYAADGDFLGEDPSCAYQPTGDLPPVPTPHAVSYGDAATRCLAWTPEAEDRLAAVPSFVRGVVARRVEEYARREGRDRVTVEMLTQVRRELPVDFSKRLPFFARGRG
ncbi:MAG: radical SAM protein [Gemmatimonadota bacterium]